jgi:hypothetical protein
MNQHLLLFGRTFRSTTLLAILLAFMVVLYAVSFADGRFHLFRPVDHGLTLNSMLEHLLRGEFDVDPATIGDEGFIRDGKIFAYFGILLALIRLPLLPFVDLSTVDVTRLSCLVAVCMAGYFKLRTAIEVYRHVQSTPLATTVFAALIAAIVLSGAQVQFLKPSIYQETILWGGAFAAAFIYCAICGLIAERGFTGSLLARMATLAGLALLTRVSIGLGLYIALTLLMVSMAWPALVERGRSLAAVAAFVRGLFTGRIVVALGILLIFAVLCGFVNYERWGNPLTFADLKINIIHQRLPDRVLRLEEYGEFNISRLWYGLIYYFFPIWALHRPDGKFLFQEFPPGSFILSDPLLIILALGFFYSLWARRGRAIVNLRYCAALLLGLAVPGFLILIAIYLAFRYRMEFYPVLELSAFLGFYVTCRVPPKVATHHGGAAARMIWIATIVGIFSSFTLLALYRISLYAPSVMVLDTGH